MQTIDARGLSCPQPVLLVQKEIMQNSPSEMMVLLDNNVAVENVTRFAEHSGYKVICKNEAEKDTFSLNITK